MSKNPKYLKKIVFITVCCLSIFSCSYRPVITSNGILNLDKRTDLIIAGTSNKNDVLNLLGETVLKEHPNDTRWAYVETIEQKKFGKKKIIKNTMLILEFDNRGVLKSKKVFNKNDFNEIRFDQTKTESLGLNNSFSKRIFSSIRKRAQNKLDTITK